MKVGDYVRTKTGIHKIFRINEKADIWKYHCDKKPTGEWDSSYEYIKVRKEDVIKSSPNIIDLIEIGDYVNGYLVKDIDYAFDDVVMNKKDARIVPYIDCNKDKYIDDIKSIVTKEQFESMEYRIGE